MNPARTRQSSARLFGDLTPAEAQTLFELLAKLERRPWPHSARKHQHRTQSPGPGRETGPAPNAGFRSGKSTLLR